MKLKYNNIVPLIANALKRFAKFFYRLYVKMPVREMKWWKKLLLWSGRGVLYLLTLALVFDINLFGLFGSSPHLSDLRSPEMNMASELYAADGTLIGRYFLENRSLVDFSELPPDLVNALLSAEDIRFYSHYGIDLRATVAAFWSTARGDRRGGSTITQQLVKNLYKTRDNRSKGLLRNVPGINTAVFKLKEWISAVKLEYYYTKNEILTLYLNTVDFGSLAFGIEAASRTFFDKSPSELTISEAALLVGLLKAPTYYSPVLNPGNALRRRNNILSQMEQYGFIDLKTKDSLVKLDLNLSYRKAGPEKEETGYFREAVARSLEDWSRISGYNIYTDGLKIYTTLDPVLQQYAEQAVRIHMKNLQAKFFEHWKGMNPWVDGEGKEIPDYLDKLAAETPHYESLYNMFSGNADSVRKYMNQARRMKIYTPSGRRDTLLSPMDSLRYYRHLLNTGFVSIDPANGYVKAWVGGIDYRFFKYDHVNQARRQPGSLFKAFVYTSAFEQGLGPCDRRTDQPVSIRYTEDGEQRVWSPHNADWVFTGQNITLKNAFARSVNSVAVQLTKEMGWDAVIETAKRMGIKSPLNSVPSVCLGSGEVTLLEIVNAYCAFANGGQLNEPVFVTKIEDVNGRVIYSHKSAPESVISEEDAFLMSVMLRSGLQEAGGTTQGLWEYDLFRYNTEFGGKTGTSSDFSDGWFIGVTPGLVSGVWVGGEHRNTRFRTSRLGEGLRTALPEYGIFMEMVLKDERLGSYRGKFKNPPAGVSRNYQCRSAESDNDATGAGTQPAGNDSLPVLPGP